MWDGTATALALLQGRVIPAAHGDAATRLDPPLEQLLLQDPYVLCLCFFWKTAAFFPGRGRGWCKVSPPLSPAPACPAPAHSARTPLTQVLSASVVAAHSGFGCSPCIPSRQALPWAQAKTCCYRSEQPGATALQLYQPSQPHWSLCAEMLALSPPLEAALPYAVLEGSVSWLYPHCSAHEFSGGRNTAQPLGQMQMGCPYMRAALALHAQAELVVGLECLALGRSSHKGQVGVREAAGASLIGGEDSVFIPKGQVHFPSLLGTHSSLHVLLLGPAVQLQAGAQQAGIPLRAQCSALRMTWVGRDLHGQPSPNPCRGLVVPPNLALSSSRDRAPTASTHSE